MQNYYTNIERDQKENETLGETKNKKVIKILFKLESNYN